MITTHYSQQKEYPNLNIRELTGLIRDQLTPSIIEMLNRIILHLESAHKTEPYEEEVNYVLMRVRKIFTEFQHHHTGEQKLFDRSIPAGKTSLTEQVKDSKRIHEAINSEMQMLHKLTDQYRCEVFASPSHKLAYAQLSVLEQDLKRLFFIEEEYLFPKFLSRTFDWTYHKLT